MLVGVFMFSVGLASAMDLDVLVNQDGVWAYGMIISGCILVFLVWRYGILRFRKKLYNEVREEGREGGRELLETVSTTL